MTFRECLILLIGAGIICFGMAAWVTKAKAAECRGVSGIASWYGRESGNRTATGEHFDGQSMTAATLIFPLGSTLRVTMGKRSVIVRDNDHGPYVRGRIIDLSELAARRLGLPGVGRVCVERIG